MSKEVTKVEAQQNATDNDKVLAKALKANNGQLQKDVGEARRAWDRIKDRERKNLDDWKAVGDGLHGIWTRLETAKGGKAPSRKEFGQAIEQAGLSDLAQQDRSAAMKLIVIWDDLPWDEITATSPRRVLQQYRQVEQARLENQTGQETGSDDRQDDAEDAEFEEVQEDEQPATGVNRTSGSEPWWMTQANRIADLDEIVLDIDPYGLASAVKGCKPVEDRLTATKRQRMRERAEQILAFLDAYEEEDDEQVAA